LIRIEEFDSREYMFSSVPNNGIGVEIGVCKGLNAISLLACCKPHKLSLVDIWTEKCPNGEEWGSRPYAFNEYGNYLEDVSSLFREEILSGQVEIFRGYGSDFLAPLRDNSLDWVYLDSDHHYDCVSIEIDLALKKVKTGGYIMGHDYHVSYGAWGSSVVRAVNERIQTLDMVMEGITLEQFPSYMCRVLK
jgi:hypothetical protein